jgi:hypothetical protein
MSFVGLQRVATIQPLALPLAHPQPGHPTMPEQKLKIEALILMAGLTSGQTILRGTEVTPHIMAAAEKLTTVNNKSPADNLITSVLVLFQIANYLKIDMGKAMLDYLEVSKDEL